MSLFQSNKYAVLTLLFLLWVRHIFFESMSSVRPTYSGRAFLFHIHLYSCKWYVHFNCILIVHFSCVTGRSAHPDALLPGSVLRGTRHPTQVSKAHFYLILTFLFTYLTRYVFWFVRFLIIALKKGWVWLKTRSLLNIFA